MTFEFGSGNLFISPAGVNTTETTPYEIATLQDVSIEMSQSIKELYGKLRSPVAIAPTEMKSTGTAKFARFNAALFNYFWGGTVTIGGQKIMAPNPTTGLPGEFGTPASGTYTVLQAATFNANLSVFDTVTGLTLQLISGGTPTSTQYKVNTSTGVFTFASGYVNPCIFYYLYTTASTVGAVTKIPNLPMGSNPTFSLNLYNNQWQGGNMLLQLYLCGSNKINFGFKNTDFMIPDFGFYFMDSGSGYIGELDTDNVG